MVIVTDCIKRRACDQGEAGEEERRGSFQGLGGVKGMSVQHGFSGISPTPQFNSDVNYPELAQTRQVKGLGKTALTSGTSCKPRVSRLLTLLSHLATNLRVPMTSILVG